MSSWDRWNRYPDEYYFLGSFSVLYVCKIPVDSFTFIKGFKYFSPSLLKVKKILAK